MHAKRRYGRFADFELGPHGLEVTTVTANAEVEMNHAFVIGSVELQKLWEILERRFGDVQATASCRDGLDRSFASFDQLAAFENPPSKRLENVRITAAATNMIPTAKLALYSSGPLPIRLQLRGSEEDVTAAKSAILDIIEGCKPWFSPVAKLDLTFVMVGFVILGWLFFQLVMGAPPQKDPVPPAAAIVAIALLCLLLAAIMAVAFGLNWVRKRFFPIGTFALGQGEKRYASDENVRWVVLVGLSISILGSMFVALVW